MIFTFKFFASWKFKLNTKYIHCELNVELFACSNVEYKTWLIALWNTTLWNKALKKFKIIILILKSPKFHNMLLSIYFFLTNKKWPTIRQVSELCEYVCLC